MIRSLDRHLRHLLLGSVIAMLAVLVVTPVLAADKKASPKGTVDGSAFRELAREGDEVVEVNLAGAVLQALAGKKTGNGELGGVLQGIQSIRAYIVELGGDTARIERAFHLAADIEEKLRSQGWASVVSIREKGSRVNVWILSDDDSIEGLVVMAVDSGKGEAVFVNIAGSVNLARLGELSGVVDVRGLDFIGGAPKSKSRERTAEKPPKEAD